MNSNCILSSIERLEIVHQFYEESKNLAKLIFSMPLNTQSDLSTIRASFISGDNLTIIQSTQDPPKISPDNPKELIIKIEPNIEEVNRGSVKIMFEDPSKIKSEKSPLIFLKKKETIISPVSYYKPPSEGTVTKTAKGTNTIAKAVVVAALLLSISSALALIKIQQMLDFLLFLNVSHPSNVKSFLQIFSQSVFQDLPNGLSFLTDDSCNITQERFLEEEVSCHIFENLGNYIVLVIMFLTAKICSLALYRVTLKKSKKISSFFKAQSEKMGLSFWLEVMESIQLDVFMTFFLGIMKTQLEKTKVSEINFLIGSLASFVAIVVNFGLIFLTHRAFQATSDDSKIDIHIKNDYKKYEFLIEDYKGKSLFQRFFRPLNNIKDLLLSFSLVVLHDIPSLQIGSIGLWLLIMSVGTVIERPYKGNKDNFVEGLRGFIYLGCCGIMLVQSAVQNTWARKKQYQVIGYPMIGLISILIIFNLGMSIYESFLSLKEKFTAVKNFLCRRVQQKDGEKQQSERKLKRNRVYQRSRKEAPKPQISQSDSRIMNLNQDSSMNDSRMPNGEEAAPNPLQQTGQGQKNKTKRTRNRFQPQIDSSRKKKKSEKSEKMVNASNFPHQTSSKLHTFRNIGRRNLNNRGMPTRTQVKEKNSVLLFN